MFFRFRKKWYLHRYLDSLSLHKHTVVRCIWANPPTWWQTYWWRIHVEGFHRTFLAIIAISRHADQHLLRIDVIRFALLSHKVLSYFALFQQQQQKRNYPIWRECELGFIEQLAQSIHSAHRLRCRCASPGTDQSQHSTPALARYGSGRPTAAPGIVVQAKASFEDLR